MGITLEKKKVKLGNQTNLRAPKFHANNKLSVPEFHSKINEIQKKKNNNNKNNKNNKKNKKNKKNNNNKNNKIIKSDKLVSGYIVPANISNKITQVGQYVYVKPNAKNKIKIYNHIPLNETNEQIEQIERIKYNAKPSNIPGPNNIPIFSGLKGKINNSKFIGEGNFGMVKSGKFKCNIFELENCDTKVMAYKMLEDKKNVKKLEEEAKMHWEAGGGKNVHNNVVRIFGLGSCETDIGISCLIIEYWEKGELKQYLETTEITASLHINLGIGICEGMEHIHERNIIHLDLAARNVLLDKNLVPNEKSKELITTKKFPYRWTHPLILNERKMSKICDIWSFGITLWEIYNKGSNPYIDKSYDEVIDFVDKI